MLAHVLLLEPTPDLLAELVAALCTASPQAEVTSVPALDALLSELGVAPEPVLVLVDRDAGDGRQSGYDVVRALRDRYPRVPVVLTAKSGDVESARQAIAAGATDFLVRGASLVERVRTLLIKVDSVLTLLVENRELSRSIAPPFEMVGHSPASRQVLKLIERVARVPRPVLIQGERGTGKELVARAIHAASGRSGVFIPINCAALAEALLEAELFGYERGAFTGAERRSKGKFEIADGGTLFLDEIGHMPLGFQQKILRAVEYGSFVRVGGAQEVRVDARIVAATNADLRERIAAGSFLADLYDRLAFEVIRVPPLRERPDDIEPLSQHFMAMFGEEVPEYAGKQLSVEALDMLRHYPFPGNVRELKNVIERAVYRDTGPVLGAADLDFPTAAGTDAKPGAFKDRIEALERELIKDALGRAGGNQAQAARLLGLSYHQFRYFHAKHGAK